MPTMPRTSDPAVIEHRLLDLAYTTDAVLTAPLLAYYVPCTIEDAERVLERLAAEGRLRMEVDDDGNIYYVFPNRQRVSPPPRPSTACSATRSQARRSSSASLARRAASSAWCSPSRC